MLLLIAQRPKTIAWFFTVLLYLDVVLAPVPVLAGNNRSRFYSSVNDKTPAIHENPLLALGKNNVRHSYNKIDIGTKDHRPLAAQVPHQTFTGGPTQPEMQAFSSVNASNMVDLFSGDFSYNIPLLDVGGYPIGLSYKGGISMDQEASWVGLGWNINPGTITRNMRGLPDDFDGKYDSVKKVMHIRENKTIGVTGGGDIEVVGFPKDKAGKKDTISLGSLGASLGVFHNNYKGWGLEYGINSSINSGAMAKGPLTAGLSMTNNSQEGLSISPSLSVRFAMNEADEKTTGSFSVSLPYNSRTGLKGLQMSSGIRQYGYDNSNQMHSVGTSYSTTISFAVPSFTPTMTMPLTNSQFSFTGKVGLEEKVNHPSFFLSGYVSKQRIEDEDTLLMLPSYGYLHLQDGAKNRSSLSDFNREKEIPYREKPAIPHIAIPAYTYDAFSITGEGTGGMFRAYRGDIGFVHDHSTRSKDKSDRLSVDVGIGDMVHGGADLNVNRAFTQSGPWLEQNSAAKVIDFRDANATFEAAYFRNPGEKSVNTKSFYDAIGGDDLVAVKLYQPGIDLPTIQATNYLTRYRNKRATGNILLTDSNVIRRERDKRTQVISYITAQEADAVALSRYIENYSYNTFGITTCNSNLQNPEGLTTGLLAQFYRGTSFNQLAYQRVDTIINYHLDDGSSALPIPVAGEPVIDLFSARWTGRVKAPVTGKYMFRTFSDDGVRLFINDSLIIGGQWNTHPKAQGDGTVYLISGQFYTIRLEWFEEHAKADMQLLWSYPGHDDFDFVTRKYLYLPATDTFPVTGMVKEKRINTFRKANHISEINVLNNDGRRYVYGIPVYNFKQKELTFAVDYAKTNKATGYVGYTPGTDNSTKNQQGKDWYFNSEEIPAYPHSFLLTGIVSPDYMDVTGNGISDDDLGDAVKFNYTKLSGFANPYRWRAPYTDSASYNEGLKTDHRDDKGNYVYGEKELWYLHSIESKTMIATFTLESRLDLNPIDESGNKLSANSAKRLKEINLYSKADFLQKGTAARPIKTVHFEYSYELCKGINKPLNDSGKLTLKKVWFTYNNNNKGQRNPYVFYYNSKNPNYNTRYYDRWGNYKDPLQNPGSTTGKLIENDEYPYSLQDSALAAANAGAWTLDSVYLPSGGSIKVKFESDDYAYVQNKRAVQQFKILGLGSTAGMTSGYSSYLYRPGVENLYVYISVPVSVSNAKEVYLKYLQGLKKLYFRMAVMMPDNDGYGSGFESIPVYADIDTAAGGGGYGKVNSNIIWIKLSGISMKGDEPGTYSPLAKAATQYLRLNLPSKAYPGSEVGDDLDLGAAVRVLGALADNIKSMYTNFDVKARFNGWASFIDTSRTWVRLNNPYYKKYGGGQRVKRITIYDNWDKMTGQRAATYGQEYTYTTTKEVNGVATIISSGVASYEPGIGGDENPFHEPVEYVEKIAPLGPVTLGYSEEPLGESFFPAAGVGYSKVRVRTINYKDKKSANGFTETQFYTAYDFPVYTDRTLLGDDTKKRFKPALANLLRVNEKYHLALSQGFKVELNDMHGKLRSEATYNETDPVNPITYTENVYKVEDQNAEYKRLSNTAMVIAPDGTIDSSAVIGKDAELMVDMREQLSITNAYNININSEVFSVPAAPPFFVIPSLFNLAQREENLFRSVAVTKIIQRYGIIDSVIHIDKGSKVSTKDIAYDSETGDVLLTRTQNEFNDPVYNFSYPSHWAYDGMGLAYKNINVILNHVNIKDGHIVSSLATADTLLFTGGDELFVAGKEKAAGTTDPCIDIPSSFPLYNKIWAVDSNLLNGGPKAIYFIDRNGIPYNGFDVTIKVMRSGRKNQLGSVGTVTSLDSMVRKGVSGNYTLALNTASKVLNATANEFKQFWKTEDRKNKDIITSCVADTLGLCNDTIPAIPLGTPLTFCFSPSKFSSYSIDAARIYAAIGSSSYDSIENNAVPFWENPGNATGGRLNRTGIWLCNACDSTGFICSPGQQWIGYSSTVYIPASGTMYIGMAGDNQVQVIIDGTDVLSILQAPGNASDRRPFASWHIYPKYLTQGYHTITVQGWNVDNSSPASFGAEIYNLTWSQLMSGDTSLVKANTIFSTVDAVGKTYATWTCPIDYLLDSSGSQKHCIKYSYCPTICDTTIGSVCKSVVTDTLFNPYIAGVLGNWRANRAYTYYGRRSESDPATATNTRTNGTFADFDPFWKFRSAVLKPAYDSNRWVWNSEMTLFNRKGMELENKDPLGRYNAGLYGYNLTLPTAVIQNARYRESAFEGFEDYGFSTQTCDFACAATRHIDYSSFKSKLDTTIRHSGKYSLKLNAGEDAGLGFSLSSVAQDSLMASLLYATYTDDCGSGTMLQHIKTSNKILLPVFSPSKGQKMLFSAWVREDKSCTCTTFDSNRVVIQLSGGTPLTLTFKPSGSIIEGWQRYESTFDIPANDTSISVTLQATGTTAVYFDDLRLHPFNANMKSFVFNPVNLRLMAELDENNYATYYEYDDDGTLIRVKKETQRGIKTIKETRSALIKE